MSAEPMLLTVEEAAARLALGRSKTWQLVQQRRLEVVRIGRSTRVPLDALEAYVARLRAEQAQ